MVFSGFRRDVVAVNAVFSTVSATFVCGYSTTLLLGIALDAGHGTQVEDKDGDEDDGYDEGRSCYSVLKVLTRGTTSHSTL